MASLAALTVEPRFGLQPAKNYLSTLSENFFAAMKRKKRGHAAGGTGSAPHNPTLCGDFRE
jgi:hypothetical protein